jgi:hypothetical protein
MYYVMMSIEVIDDIQGAEENIMRANPPPYVFVNACYRSHESDLRSKFEGCRVAYELLEGRPGAKVLVYGVLSQTTMYGIPDFLRLMIEFPENVRYFGLIPRGFDGFNDRDPFKKPNHVSPALKLVAGRKFRINEMSRLKHDMRHVRGGGERYAGGRKKLIEDARRLGLSGTDDEIEEQIMSYQRDGTPPNFSERLAGVYCDVEGTLLSGDKLNESLREELDAMSCEKPVTLWTGSGPWEKAVQLNRYDLEWPILSKDWFRGCAAEFVLDDMTQEEFEKEYGIKAEAFRQV